MKKIMILMAVLLVGVIAACTEKGRARSLGGKTTIELPCNERLLNATWKESNLWYLTRPMEVNENPQNYKFREDSSFGIMEGTVTFIECRK